MPTYPIIRQAEHSVVVEFAPNQQQVKRHSIEMVLDYGESGEVIGIEIINLTFEAGKSCLGLISGTVPGEGDGLKFSYDEDCDAFYLRLRLGRSLYQKAVQGKVCLDSDGRMVGLEAEW